MNPDRVTDIVHWELESGERPIWFGWPHPESYVWATTRWGRVLFGVPSIIVALVMTPVSPPIGVLLMVIGLGTFGTPVWNYLKAKNTVYVVTDRRLIVIEQFMRRSVTSCPGSDIERVERRERGNGIGSLIFARIETSVVRDDGFKQSMVEEQGFFGIQGVGEVWRLVLKLKDQSARG